MTKADYREIIKEENQKKILWSLKEKGNLTFKILLEETGLARSTLASHLKDLLEAGKIERFYNTYRITQKGIPEVQVEGMIQHLGIVATHFIIRKKLKLPIEEESDIYKEIENWLKQEPKDVTWKQLFDYLQEKHPLTL